MKKYRPDIDGLRAIAVSLVIAFHFGAETIKGGFIGVDVFFVLSGYLIGGVTCGQLRNNSFSFINFYFRRIRRLFPAYIVVISATSIFAYLWMLPHDFREYSQSIFASTVYISNILFYLESGYFDTASHLKPLLHTWSLSVEEQFYLVFPLVAWLTFRLSRHLLLPVFIFLFLVSFIGACVYIYTDQSAAFYLYPFRAWEMFIGVLIALKPLPKVTRKHLSMLISIIGLVLILIPAFLYNQTTLFPGFSALFPCLGTACLIYANESSQNAVKRVLSSTVPVFIGKISYSLYLWHWPVFVLYNYVNPGHINLYESLSLLLATISLSVLTWKYVETPFRSGRLSIMSKPLNVYVSAGLISFVFLFVGYWGHITGGAPNRFEGEKKQFALAANDLFGDLGHCQPHENRFIEHASFCSTQDAFKKGRISVIWGDSHAAAYKAGIDQALSNSKDVVVEPQIMFWAGGCPPLFGVEKDETVASSINDRKCGLHNNAVSDFLKDNASRISSIVILSRWSYYTSGSGVGADEQNKVTVWPSAREGEPRNYQRSQAEFVINQLEFTLRELKSFGINDIFVVQQVPEFAEFSSRDVALKLIRGSKHFDSEIRSVTQISYQEVSDRQAEIEAFLGKAEKYDLANIIYTHNRFCDKTSCELIVNSTPTYYDNNHLSTYGAKYISSVFRPYVDTLIKRKKYN